MAKIETPRGAASLHLTLKAGRVSAAQITTPFAAHAALIGGMTAQTELADALTATPATCPTVSSGDSCAPRWRPCLGLYPFAKAVRSQLPSQNALFILEF